MFQTAVEDLVTRSEFSESGSLAISFPIVILGDAPGGDVALLRETAGRFGIGLVICAEEGDLAVLKRPIGCISYLPWMDAVAGGVLDSALRGVGEGVAVPLFQRIEGDDIPVQSSEPRPWGFFVSPLSQAAAWTIVLTMVKTGQAISRVGAHGGEVGKGRKYGNMPIDISTAFSGEHELNRLLSVILRAGREVTGADAGSIYIRERSGPGGTFIDVLRFKAAQNDSMDVGRSMEFSVPIDEYSIAGYVARTGLPLTICDMKTMDCPAPYLREMDFQKKIGYCIKSMLALPLKNLEGEVVGVLQLMNKKEDPSARIDSPERCEEAARPFTREDEEFIASMASLAAVSIDRAQMYENIRELFEGFLRSSIAAIDERDHVTSGHSKRVMGYAMAFAEAAGADPGCPFAAIASSPERKRQFQFAALLHDIGKIGVPERVLTKDRRLPSADFAAVLSRLDIVEFALRYAPESVSWKSAEEVGADRRFLERINGAGSLTDDDARRLEEVRDKVYHAADGRRMRFLGDAECSALSVRYGNLTPEERRIINSHAVSTYRILSRIPWTRQLEMIPAIASTHHEKIDGSGYPFGLRGDKISLESKVLAVIDIYEALVAQDRPYKPRMAPERALGILGREVEAGRLDGEVVRFFTEKEIYKLYTDRT